MTQQPLQRYISKIYESYVKNSEINYASLDILEQFAWEKCLSAYQIFSNLKSTPLEMAYKNVNKRVNALLSSGLIQEIETDGINNKHNAKYYRLTEYGIYQLFLNRLNSLLVNQTDVRKSKELSSNASVFFRNYSECLLFDIFLYPYFRKNTLFAIGDRLLWHLYHYLSDCCRSIGKCLKYSKMLDIPVIDKIFSWNKIPGEDDKLLLSHLGQIFNLEGIESNDIIREDTVEGDPPSITVNTSSAPILIKLDKERNEVIVTSTAGNGGFKEFLYDIHYLGQEMVVSRKLPHEGSIKPVVNEVEKRIEQLIYEFVYDLASSPKDSESSYYYDILSRDHKFMRAVKEIYETKHKVFERGYELLRKYNVKR